MDRIELFLFFPDKDWFLMFNSQTACRDEAECILRLFSVKNAKVSFLKYD